MNSSQDSNQTQMELQTENVEVSQDLRNFEGGGGGGEETQSTDMQTDTTSEQQTQVTEKSLLTDADVSRLAQAIGTAIPSAGQNQASTQQQQQREYTPEEINRLLNVFEPSDNLIAKLTDPSTMKEGMAELVAGIRKEYNTLLAVQLKSARAEIDGEYGTVKEQAMRQAAEKADKEFYGEYKDLDNPKAREIIPLVLSALHQKQAFNGKNKTEAAKLIAGETRAMLKRLGVSASPDGSGTPQQQQSGSSRRPAALSSGAGGGAHGGGGSATATGVSADLRNLFG